MNVSLTPELEKYARNKVSSGLYGNASELVREALRLMIQREQDHDRLKEAVGRGFQQIEEGKLTRVDNKDEFLAMARGKRSK